MKNTFYNIIVIVLVIIFSTGCKKEETIPETTNTTTTSLIGQWKVTSFIKDSIDVTGQFNGYTIDCTTDGKMTIHGNGHSYENCNWNLLHGSNTMCNFHVMDCDTQSVLWLLNQDWVITNHDTEHCYFSSHNPTYPCEMTWSNL